MRFIILFIIMIVHFLPTISLAQNLIHNPSFESQKCCPDGYSQFHCANDWIRPTKGTSDYYSGCENRFYSPEAKVPKNFFGSQDAYEGISYIGIFAFYKDSYREYIEMKLTEPMIKNQRYGFSIQVSLADKAGIAIQSLGVVFSDTLVKQRDLFFTLNLPHEKLEKEDKTHFINKENWTELYIDYTAKGGEQFLIIGNFLNNSETDTITAKTTTTSYTEEFTAYYYLDNVCLATWKSDNTCTCFNNGEPPIIEQEFLELKDVTKEVPPKVGDKFILNNIYFETAKATLLPTSNLALDSLYNLLVKYPTIEIQISGHTDSQGAHKYNLVLSESRALAVYSYLVDRGISTGRLDFNGFGKMKPITTNETSEGRQMNRRVEFEVMKISTK
ncbi:MAG: OOP family OmpA-OmpF porin [Cognaticolwellia sp.]|jgi:OOP family OmpA-OmpF porin